MLTYKTTHVVLMEITPTPYCIQKSPFNSWILCIMHYLKVVNMKSIGLFVTLHLCARAIKTINCLKILFEGCKKLSGGYPTG